MYISIYSVDWNALLLTHKDNNDIIRRQRMPKSCMSLQSEQWKLPMHLYFLYEYYKLQSRDLYGSMTTMH